MADFTFVTARIATGAALRSKADVRKILVAGINVLIDCRETTDGPLLNGHSAIEYLWNPTADDGTPKPPEYWARSLTFVLPLLSQPHTKVLCHCTSGINRGPSTAYAIMVALTFPPALAENLIRTARPIVGLRYKADALAACQELGYV
jgi:dual specificity phosphatase 3